MPRSMAHPDYVYRPVSDEKKARMSAAHKARLGIPAECHRVYGVLVPNERADRMRAYALIIAGLKGYEAARSFVSAAAADQWEIERPSITARGQRDWSLYRELLAEGMTREEVARFANVAEWYLNRGVIDHRNGRIKP
jgi:hypothetical protein